MATKCIRYSNYVETLPQDSSPPWRSIINMVYVICTQYVTDIIQRTNVMGIWFLLEDYGCLLLGLVSKVNVTLPTETNISSDKCILVNRTTNRKYKI